ncbi:MAG: RluA family pseudouridine synthase [Lentisphaeria bacterium]|nr:RluA family pseudouridine synthase [Lentisphaeria bacterium]
MDLSQRIIRSSIDWSGAGIKLVDYLAGRFTYRSESEWEKRIASGEITLNSKIVPPDTVLQLHDIIEYRPGDIVEPPADLDYKVVFEDEILLVIDKPGNLCMHPAGPFFKHTLWHLLASKYDQIHFVNRLDRETSGLLLATKHAKYAKTLLKNITAKHYMAIIHGDFPESLQADGFLLSANSIIRKKRKFVFDLPDSPPFESASTDFCKISSANGLSLVKAVLHTGRMHQIRATLNSLGYPVAGDKLYGLDEKFYLKQRSDELSDADREKLLVCRQALHSCYLELIHPEKGEKISFSSPLPAQLQNLIK